MDNYFDFLNEDMLITISGRLLYNITDMVNLSNAFNIFQIIFSKRSLYLRPSIKNDKYILYVFNQEVSKSYSSWIDIYSIYCKLKYIRNSYFREIRELYKNKKPNGGLEFGHQLYFIDGLLYNIDVFDIPGFDKYQLLINFINYTDIYVNTDQHLIREFFITKQKKNIVIHEKYYTE